MELPTASAELPTAELPAVGLPTASSTASAELRTVELPSALPSVLTPDCTGTPDCINCTQNC
eukprot:6850463-Pyramimonas_sp.AAC.1